MDSNVDQATCPSLLIIADISGYTRYMTANAKTLAHSQTIITELVNALISRVELPLQVAKLEGDAVFLFCRQATDSLTWMAVRARISQTLLEFFRLFDLKLRDLARSIHCRCDACTHIEKLRLKVVVHFGEVLFHRVLHFQELSGVDVIIVHRLLKNSVPAEHYLLLTEAAVRELQFPEAIAFKAHAESYENLGRLKFAFYDFNLERSNRVAEEAPSLFRVWCDCVRIYLKLWLGPITAVRPFRNLPETPSRLGQVSFAILSVLLSPVWLVIAPMIGLYHAVQSAAAGQPTCEGIEKQP